MKMTVCRKEHFNSAHRLYNPNWSDEENFRFYGKCASPNYHGHNYYLVVKLTGEVDKETGYLVDLGEVRDVVHEEVIDKFDHRNLNLDTKEFQTLIPTTENFAGVIWNKLRKRFDDKYELAIELHETEKNFVEYSGG